MVRRGSDSGFLALKNSKPQVWLTLFHVFTRFIPDKEIFLLQRKCLVVTRQRQDH